MQNSYFSNDYSEGDGDMILLELAMEQYINNHIDDNDPDIEEKLDYAFRATYSDGYDYNVLNNNVPASRVSLQHLVGATSGNQFEYFGDGLDNSYIRNYGSIDDILRAKAQNSSSYAIMCDFDVAQGPNEADGIIENHVYEVSSKLDEQDNLMVILTNPHDTAAKIELSADDFENILII